MAASGIGMMAMTRRNIISRGMMVKLILLYSAFSTARRKADGQRKRRKQERKIKGLSPSTEYLPSDAVVNNVSYSKNLYTTYSVITSLLLIILFMYTM